MSSQTLRVGVVGAGGNTRLHHIPKLQAIPGVEVVTVANRSRASAQRVADEFGIARVVDHWGEVIADDTLDAVVIGTWPNLHARVTVAALAAGKHVLCEARMARDVAEARAMAQASHARPELICQIVPSPFTLRQDAAISRVLSEGVIGDLVQVEVSACGAYVDPAASITWRQSREISGVNIMALGIWYEALMRWVGEATRVSAFARTIVARRPDDDGVLRTVDVPDHLDLIGELACGAQLRMVLSQATASAAPDGAQLYGTAGTVHVTGDRLSITRPGAEPEAVPVAEDAAGWRVEEEFVGAIRGTEPVRHTTVDDALRYMLFTEAVHRSIHEHRQVSLSEL